MFYKPSLILISFCLLFVWQTRAQLSRAELGGQAIFLPKSDSSRGKPLWQPYYTYPREGKQHISLDGSWDMAYTNAPINKPEELKPEKPWVPVQENATVQSSLYKAGLLPDPYAHLNAEQYHWVEQKAWYYKKSFTVPAEGKGNYTFLNFDGIDYYARIWLNGQLLGQHEGMFGGPAIEVSKYLHYGGDNQLLVEVLSANYGRKAKFNPKAPGRVIKGWAFTGGTGVEPFFTVGLWKGARLDIVNPIHIERPFLSTQSITDSGAVIRIDLEAFYKTQTLDYKLHPWGNAILSRGVPSTQLKKVKEALALRVTFTDGDGEEQSEDFPLSIFEGRNWLQKTMLIHRPKLWWPNGLGKASQYRVELTLHQQGKELDHIALNYGIRTIETLPNAGPKVEERWKNWHFSINGKPIFLKGMNWMPADVLLDMPVERYRWLLEMAKAEGVQLIRVWGSGLLETETFYELCSELGIMVWQDFPISHYDAPDYPPDVWEAQILYTVFRIRNHASLAVYNGGNGHNPYSYGNNRTLGILERVLADFDPTRLFSRTTSDAGNAHLYPDIDPSFYPYVYKYIPLVSETGMHSLSDPAGLQEIIQPKEFQDLGNIYSKEFVASHPEFISHFAEFEPARVPRMLSRASHIADIHHPTLETMAEATQTGAAEFYQVLSDGLQGNYPYTSGVMPWVFNRTWPVVSAIMLVDGFGQPSIPYYFLKRTYEPVHAKLDLPRLLWKAGEHLPLGIKIISSEDSTIHTTASVQVYNDAFQSLYRKELPLEVPAGTSVTPLSLGAYTIPADYKDQYLFIVVQLRDKRGMLISQSAYWPRSLRLMEDPAFYKKQTSLDSMAPWPTLNKGPWLKATVERTKGTLKAILLKTSTDTAGYQYATVQIKNTGRIPLFMTHIEVTGAKRVFYADDNYFWLEAGEERTLQLKIKWREPIQGKKPLLSISAWNANGQSFNLTER